MRIRVGKPFSRIARATAAVGLAMTLGIGGFAAGQAHATPESAQITQSVADGQTRELSVYSPSMGRVIPVTVLVPRDQSRPAPVFYLLNGAGGGEDRANWGARTDYRQFFADKHVYVVTPQQGMFSYYTDWERDDPTIGRHKWETFLTRELPPVLATEFNTSGRNGIAGISMAGTSVLNLAARNQGMYQAVASYSGCAQTSDPLGQAYIRTLLEGRGNANPENMWGPYGGPGWLANDPYVNAHKLRGKTIYLSSYTGLPGEDESLSRVRSSQDAVGLLDQVVLGGGIEAAMNACTHLMAGRLAELGIPATVVFRGNGTHSWGYWQRELKASWPTLERGLRG